VSKLSELVAVRVMGGVAHDTFRPDRNIVHAMRIPDYFNMVRMEQAHGSWTVTIEGGHETNERELTIALCIAALRACGVPEREIEEARKQQ
jgi:hypothetical protein